jgi:hypothetical protein
MAHGRPDFNLTAGVRTTYRWSDFDELAARLGSPVSYDRRGDVIFIESFEHGDGMITWATGGAGSTAGLSLARARTGHFSAALYTPSVANAYAHLTRRGVYPAVSPLGAEISFTLVKCAADMALAGRVQGIVTGPISKAKWLAAGISSPGHTDFMSAHAGVSRYAMSFWSPDLRLVLYTIHLPLREVCGRIHRQAIVSFVFPIHFTGSESDTVNQNAFCLPHVRSLECDAVQRYGRVPVGSSKATEHFLRLQVLCYQSARPGYVSASHLVEPLRQTVPHLAA